MTDVVSVINYKGGVGKTTVTANLGAELAFRGRHVLLVDLDPQASLTFSFIKPDQWQRDLEDNGTIKRWFDSLDQREPVQLQDLIVTPSISSGAALRDKGAFDLLPSHLGLINVDLDLATELGGASPKKQKRNYLKVHTRLAEGLSSLDEDAYDIILIDCPPNFNIVTKNALVASDYIITPAKPDYLSTLGIDYLKRNVDELVENFNWFASSDGGSADDHINPTLLGVIFTMVKEYDLTPISRQRPYMGQVKRLGIPVFDAYIKDNPTLFAGAPEQGCPVVLSSPSDYYQRRVVLGLEKVATEFLTHLNDSIGGSE